MNFEVLPITKKDKRNNEVYATVKVMRYMQLLELKSRQCPQKVPSSVEPAAK